LTAVKTSKSYVSFSEFLSQSLAVKFAAFNCRWYDHSTKVKKLLQMTILRSQYPVRLTAGKFYVVSLETFADVRTTQESIITMLLDYHTR
jgi:hypothetical protein